jgi:hypothetical protein
MFTEKTYKFISAKKPFILAGFTGSLQMLREFGYKTFHPYINESYDNIESDSERLWAIINEVNRLCRMTDSEWIEWQHNIKSIVEYNSNYFLNKSLEHYRVHGVL